MKSVQFISLKGFISVCQHGLSVGNNSFILKQWIKYITYTLFSIQYKCTFYSLVLCSVFYHLLYAAVILELYWLGHYLIKILKQWPSVFVHKPTLLRTREMIRRDKCKVHCGVFLIFWEHQRKSDSSSYKTLLLKICLNDTLKWNNSEIWMKIHQHRQRTSSIAPHVNMLTVIRLLAESQHFISCEREGQTKHTDFFISCISTLKGNSCIFFTSQ